MSEYSPVFTTDRLMGLSIELDDAQLMYEVYSDPEIYRWVDDGKPIVFSDCEKWVEITINNYERRGYGMFKVIEAESHSHVGFCGIVHPHQQEEPEIKYALRPQFWRNGYATELVHALIQLGNQEHQIDEFIATVDFDHAASQRVLLKNGFVKTQERLYPDGSLEYVYSLELSSKR